jgi:hypothetical protein
MVFVVPDIVFLLDDCRYPPAGPDVAPESVCFGAMAQEFGKQLFLFLGKFGNRPRQRASQ